MLWRMCRYSRLAEVIRGCPRARPRPEWRSFKTHSTTHWRTSLSCRLGLGL
ncbi:unnamed protein product [Symbiodinium sp. KB8]|nr:unnamed protein product [Symbiodinium sp. KB8]